MSDLDLMGINSGNDTEKISMIKRQTESMTKVNKRINLHKLNDKNKNMQNTNIFTSKGTLLTFNGRETGVQSTFN